MAEDASSAEDAGKLMVKMKIETAEKVRFCAAVLVALFAAFSLISCLSFIFSWKMDQSLLDAPSFFAESGMQVENTGGPFGAGLGNFLVASCFGLGAIIFCCCLGVLSVKLFLKEKIEWLRTSVLSLCLTMLSSLLLAYISTLGSSFGWDKIWGGGLGGNACLFLVSGLKAALGPVFSILVIVAAIVMFAAAFGFLSVSGKNAAAQSDVADEQTEEYEQGGESEDEFEMEDDFVDEPGPEPVPEPAPAAVVSEAAGYEDVEDAIDEPSVTIEDREEELSTDVEEDLPQLDIRSDVDRFKTPSLDLLKDYADKRYNIPREEIDRNIERIKATLASFKIPITNISASVGYTVTLYRITLGEGVRVNSVKNLEEDISIQIGIKGVRVVMLSDSVGIEVPNEKSSVVPLKAILNSDSFRNSKGELPVALGYTITTKAKVFDLADAPHLLVAGATKQGKSVGLNAIISSLLYAKHPTELKFVFIDPKMVEFQKYSKLIRHYLALLPPANGEDEADSAIVKDPKNAEAVLRSLCVEMDERYKLLSSAGVNKVTDYNEKYRNRFLRPDEGHHFMPYLVVVVDEYADLTKASFGSDRNLSRSIENSINRLAAKGRAAGLHVIIATQRPSVDVITGTIKGNFPTRMAFRTAQRQDSQTILGMVGAERLIGRGDMLFFTGADAERVQCALVDSDEIDSITNFIASQTGYKQCCIQPYYLPDPGDGEGDSDGGEKLIDMKNIDPMFEEAARLAVMNMGLSTSMLQRKLQLGFARAGRIVDQLEAAGIVGPQQGARPREALVQDLASLQPILDAFIKK